MRVNQFSDHMKKYLLLVCCITIATLALYLYQCYVDSSLSKSASKEDFEGVWFGKLNPDAEGVFDIFSTIEINGLTINYSNLPTRDGQGKITFRSGTTSFDYRETYSIDAPCVLLDCNSTGGLIFPIYLHNDKKRLYYPISPARGLYMELEKRKTNE